MTTRLQCWLCKRWESDAVEIVRHQIVPRFASPANDLIVCVDCKARHILRRGKMTLTIQLACKFINDPGAYDRLAVRGVLLRRAGDNRSEQLSIQRLLSWYTVLLYIDHFERLAHDQDEVRCRWKAWPKHTRERRTERGWLRDEPAGLVWRINN